MENLKNRKQRKIYEPKRKDVIEDRKNYIIIIRFIIFTPRQILLG